MDKVNLPIIIMLIYLFMDYTNNSFKQAISYDQATIAFNDSVDSIIANKMNQYNIPGLAIGLVMKDSVVHSKGYGLRSIKSDEPVTEFSNFHTASISKLFTAQAVYRPLLGQCFLGKSSRTTTQPILYKHVIL